MTAKAVAPKIRPVSTVYEIELTDDAGRTVHYRLQVDARRVTMWTSESDGGSVSIPDLFGICCQNRNDRGSSR